jgi:hypothetical protein
VKCCCCCVLGGGGGGGEWSMEGGGRGEGFGVVAWPIARLPPIPSSCANSRRLQERHNTLQVQYWFCSYVCIGGQGRI